MCLGIKRDLILKKFPVKTWIMLSKRFKETCFTVQPGKLLCLSKSHALTSRYRAVGFYRAYMSPLFPTPPMHDLFDFRSGGKKIKIRSRDKIFPSTFSPYDGASRGHHMWKLPEGLLINLITHIVILYSVSSPFALINHI